MAIGSGNTGNVDDRLKSPIRRLPLIYGLWGSDALQGMYYNKLASEVAELN